MRKVFIDCGANKGLAIDGFREVYDPDHEFEVFAFECFPECINILNEKYDDVTVIEKAVYKEEGELTFNVGITTKSGTVRKDKQVNMTKNTVTVASVDLAQWILDNFSQEDEIVMTMDIEGAEYDILPRMIETGAVTLLNRFYIEWHDSKLAHVSQLESKKLEVDLQLTLGDNLIVGTSGDWDIAQPRKRREAAGIK